jgi:capsular polysaccharide biosynthesis protein
MTETVSPRRMENTPSPKRLGRHRRQRTLGAAVILGVAVVVVSALASLWVSLRQTRLYGAQTDIVFDPGPELSDTAVTRWLLTQELVLRSGAVLGPVSNTTKIPIRDIERFLTIEVVGQSNVIRFMIANPDPGTALKIAQLITEEYKKQLPALLPTINVQENSNVQLIRWAILTPPHVLEEPVKPQPVQALALGALAGIFIAAGMILLLAWPRLARNDRLGTGDL